MSPYKDRTIPRRIMLAILCTVVGIKVFVTLLEAAYPHLP